MNTVINWIMDKVFSFLEALVNIFPDMPEAFYLLPEEMSTYISWVGHIIDVNALVFVIGVFITYETAMIVVRVSLFLWRLTPFS